MRHFKDLFADQAIRVWIDWEALDDTNCRVSTHVVNSALELGAYQTAWYRRGAILAEWRDQEAARGTVAEEARRSAAPARLTLPEVPHLFPALDLGGKGSMLLDGNHRAVHLVSSGKPFTALILTLHGPVDPLTFPDLLHHTHKHATPEIWQSLVESIDRQFMTTPAHAGRTDNK